MSYQSIFDFESWWADASYQVAYFFKHAGTTEMGVMAGIVMVVGLVCMRGFQIR